MAKKECNFQHELIETIKSRFPGAIVLKNDANYIQGIPDLTVFYGSHWATLECKRSAKSKRQPNQEYYVGAMNKMSFSRFVYPENREEVLDELSKTFGT